MRGDRRVKLLELLPQFGPLLFERRAHAPALRTQAEPLGVEFRLLLIRHAQGMFQTLSLMCKVGLLRRPFAAGFHQAPRRVVGSHETQQLGEVFDQFRFQSFPFRPLAMCPERLRRRLWFGGWRSHILLV
jgi:hypothetical protein